MKIFLRLFLLAVSVITAAAAFSHAASENGSTMGLALYGRSSLNGQVLGLLADQSFRLESSRTAPATQTQLPPMPGAVVGLARASFAVDPLEVPSLRTIVLGEVLQRDEGRARQAMRLASRISKRDAITDLWLAQDYGRVGDTEGMLVSFDQALRVSVSARQFAMKPLVETLASEESFVPLGRLLARRPEWEEEFWPEFFRNPVGLANAERFFTESGISVNHFPVEGRSRLYTDLKRAEAFDSIVHLAAQDPSAKSGDTELIAGKFVTTTEGNPFGWTVHSQGRFSTQVSDKERGLAIDAEPGAFGLAADRIARVDGDQDLVVALSDPLPDYTSLELSAKCAHAGGRPLASLRIGAGESEGRTRLSPGACRFVALALSFAVEQGRHGASMRISRVTLRPL
jgi:hypothetical protein